MLPPSELDKALTRIVNPGPNRPGASGAEIKLTKARAQTTAKLAAAVSKKNMLKGMRG